MIVLGWFAVLLAGLALALYASTRTVRHARALAQGTRIPPFFIGVTLLAIGTDLPEIANSIISCMRGQGDLNAGDSIGSTVTQATLVLGLLPLLGGALAVKRVRVLVILGACLAGLALGAVLMADGFLSRTDGIVLAAAWLVGSALIWKQLSPAGPVDAVQTRKRLHHVLATFWFLALVAVGAGSAVSAFVRLSELLGVHPYVLSFFVASVGTSLPELVVDVAALRAGLKDLALGDVLGSSFVDATLSIGIGPILFPALVTANLAVFGSVVAIGALALAGAIVSVRATHDWISGVALLLVYAGVYLLLLG
jgi:cation:H+ antiporter